MTIRDDRDDVYGTGDGLKKIVTIDTHRHGDKRQRMKFGRDAGWPFQRAVLPGCCPQTAGAAPLSPLGERKGTFDMEDAVRNVESAFALLLERVTEPRLAPGKGSD